MKPIVENSSSNPGEHARLGGGAIPLCVDLDGTLIKTDVLIEGIVQILTGRDRLRRLPKLLVSDRARLKQRVAELAALDPGLLPYNEEFLKYLQGQKASGRTLVLVTAADARIAHAVADHLSIFDDVLCSDGVTNIKGEAKAAALFKRFGHRGFDYAGNDAADLPAWREARNALVVNAPRGISSKITTAAVDTSFAARAPLFGSALKAMRPHQWSKNFLVFVPLIMAHAVTDLTACLQAGIAFLSFCATASSIYLINDIADIAADRRHPRKRNRPLASGKLSLPAGVILAVLCGGVGLTLAFLIHNEALMVVYAATSTAYSIALKEFPIVDVFVLAALYTIRVLSGGVATGHDVSLWLLAFSGFLFLSLALVKRTGEMAALVRSSSAGVAARRGYFVSDLAVLMNFGCASSFASGIVLALFVGSDAAILHYATPQLLWGIVPLILFWQCRLWLSTTRGHMHDDPIVYAAHDWVSWIVIVCVLLIVTAATIGVPLSIVGIAGA